MTESKYLKREFGEALPTFKGVMKQHQINKLEEGWWDNMSDEAQAAYIKKYGEAPGSTGDDDKGDKARATAKSRDKALDKSIWGDDEDDYDMGEVPGSRGTGPWTPEDDPDFEHGPSLTSAPGRVPDEDEYPDKDPINTKKGEMEDEMEDIANELDNVTDPDEKKELEDRYDKIDQELYDINKKQYGDDSGYEKSGRTGKELDQETLTINGKQYNRISEGVEKQPKDLRDRSKKMKKHKLQENYERMFGSIKEDWWDDMSPENQAQYIKDHPNSKQAKDAGGDDEGGGDNSERLGQIAQERAAAEQEMADAEEMGDKAAYADAQEKIDDLDKEEAELGGSGEQEPSGEGDDGAAYPDGNAPPEIEPEYMSRPHEIEEMIEKLEEYKIHLNKWAEEAADNDDDETLANPIQALMDENEAKLEGLKSENLPRAKNFYPAGRTGKELDQETLTIDGKQYSRISEMTSKTKRDMENSFETSEDLDDFITKHQDSIPKSQWRKIDNYLDDIRDEEEGMKSSGWADPAKKGLKKILTRYIKESVKPKYEFSKFYKRFKR